MKKFSKKVSTVSDGLLDAADTLQNTLTTAEEALDKNIDPYRKSLLKRFPTVFLFLATFGVVATFFGIEQILLQYEVLNDYPWLIFALGIGTLTLTGTLYRKLN